VRITVEIRRPGWMTPKRLKRARPLVLLLALALASPVLASDTFSDVPTDSVHHNDINTIKVAGITQGCNPPANTLYCPADSVRRDQMASFLQRGLGRGGRGSGSSTITTSGFDLVAAASESITVPGSGFVLVTGSIVASGGSGCPCIVSSKVRDDDSGVTSAWYMYETLDNTVYSEAYAATTSTWMFPVAAGTHTFSVVATRFNGTGTTTIYGQVTAVWVPFGPTGGSTLGVSGSSDAPSDPTQVGP
jgi:hypothetical protein